MAHLYRAGGTNPSNLRPRPGEDDLSFRDSLTNPWPLPEGEQPVFRPGERFLVINTTALPPEAIIVDNEPDGHVSVVGVDVETLKKAVIDQGKLPK